jgi:tetratricopeptide (TPR) repeat protein
VRSHASLFAGLLASVGCATTPLEEREWLEIDTPHFEVVSSLGRTETLDLARDAELFHAAMEYVLGTPLPPPAVPTRIYAFDDRSLTRPFAVRGEPGYFRASHREAVLVLRTGDGWGADATERVRHEYVHYALRSWAGAGPPLWLDEGAAEFLSTVEVDGDRVELGRLREDHVRLLRGEHWVPLLRILETRDLEGWADRKRSLFTAESWAFVHYLNFGAAIAERRSGLASYLERIAAGAAPEDALRETFGMGSADLDRSLQRYVRGQSFGSAEVRPATIAVPEPRPLAPDEAMSRLGWLSITLRKPEQARRWFEKAVAANPRNARAHAGLAAAGALLERWDEASAHLETALAAAPDDPLNHLDAAAYYLGRARSTASLPKRAELLAAARRHAARGSELDRSLPEAYATYGTTYLVPGEEPAGGEAALEHATRVLPASLETRLLLARVRARVGRSGEAREMVLSVLSRTHSDAIRAEAQQILSVIDGTTAGRRILKGPGADPPAGRRILKGPGAGDRNR